MSELDQHLPQPVAHYRLKCPGNRLIELPLIREEGTTVQGKCIYSNGCAIHGSCHILEVTPGAEWIYEIFGGKQHALVYDVAGECERTGTPFIYTNIDIAVPGKDNA